MPDLVLNLEFVAILEQRETLQKLILFQELTELLESLCLRHEITTTLGTMLLERRLNLLEHMQELLLSFARHDLSVGSVETVDNMRDMVVFAIQLELLQNLTHLCRLDVSCILNPLLFEFRDNAIKYILGNLRGLLGLELCQEFLKMVDTLVCVLRRLSRGVLVRRAICINKNKLRVSAVLALEHGFVRTQNHVLTASVAFTQAVCEFIGLSAVTWVDNL